VLIDSNDHHKNLPAAAAAKFIRRALGSFPSPAAGPVYFKKGFPYLNNVPSMGHKMMTSLNLLLASCILSVALSAPTFLASSHYGNPYDGSCQSGEKNITDLHGGDKSKISFVMPCKATMKLLSCETNQNINK